MQRLWSWIRWVIGMGIGIAGVVWMVCRNQKQNRIRRARDNARRVEEETHKNLKRLDNTLDSIVHQNDQRLEKSIDSECDLGDVFDQLDQSSKNR